MKADEASFPLTEWILAEYIFEKKLVFFPESAVSNALLFQNRIEELDFSKIKLREVSV